MTEPEPSNIGTVFLSDLGAGMTEVRVASWKVAVGDSVTVDDVLLEVGTATSRVALRAPFAGVVARILVQEGQRAAVGTAILSIGLKVDLAHGMAHQPIPEDAAGGLILVKGFPKTVPMDGPAAESPSPIQPL